MKILWHANAPFAPTGYGQQTALFAPRIRDLGHDVAISATWGITGAATVWNDMKVYPADEAWGNKRLRAWAADHGGEEECQVISLMDVWTLEPDKMPPRMAAWLPVDHQTVPTPTKDFLAKAKHVKPIAMSEFGVRALIKIGREAPYVPHGFDGQVFYPRSADERRAARKKSGIPESAFVVGICARNAGAAFNRKAIPQMFQAFSRFREIHRDAFLYVHSDPFAKEGVNLRQCAVSFDIPLRSVRYTDPVTLDLGVSPLDVADLLGAFDVLTNTSFGEGFGIPIIEAQACGTPTIVTDSTAMSELAGNGWLVGGEEWYDATQDSKYISPNVAAIEKALLEAYETAYQLRAGTPDYVADYEVDNVVERYWKPTLAMLEGRVAEEAAA